MFLTILVPNKDLTVQHLVVAEDVVEHLLVQLLRWRLESDLHTASLFGLEVDIPITTSTVLAEISTWEVAHTEDLDLTVYPQLPAPPPATPSVPLSLWHRES